jgi:hypothetical protein
MKICNNCGTKNADENVFCSECGYQFDLSVQTRRKSTEEKFDIKSKEKSTENIIKIQPTKMVICPHCNINVEIKAIKNTKMYRCPNCNRLFEHNEPYNYKCLSCLSDIIINPNISEHEYFCHCGWVYELELGLASSPTERTVKSGLGQISFGFLFIVGFLVLFISLFSYSNLNTTYQNNIPSELIDNFLAMVLSGLILWGVVSAFLAFVAPERELIIMEGVSILIIEMILTFFTVIIHSNPIEFSSQLSIALIIVYIVWASIRLMLIAMMSSGGQSTSDFYFWLCVCDSCGDCGNCDCSGCDCGDCDCGGCDC